MTTSRAYRELASAVIMRAMNDAKEGAGATFSEAREAKWFLNNSYALEFYAEIAGCVHEFEKAGFLKRG